MHNGICMVDVSSCQPSQRDTTEHLSPVNMLLRSLLPFASGCVHECSNFNGPGLGRRVGVDGLPFPVVDGWSSEVPLDSRLVCLDIGLILEDRLPAFKPMVLVNSSPFKFLPGEQLVLHDGAG